MHLKFKSPGSQAALGEFRAVINKALAETIAAENHANEVWRQIDRSGADAARVIFDELTDIRKKLTELMLAIERLP